MAETAARLLLREDELGRFEVFHFGGHWLEPGVEMADAIHHAVDKPGAPIKRFPWFAVTLLSPFVETFREMREMRYLWKKPARLDNAKLLAFLGHEPHTHLDIAVRTTLAGLGCIGAAGPDNANNPGTESITVMKGTI